MFFAHIAQPVYFILTLSDAYCNEYNISRHRYDTKKRRLNYFSFLTSNNVNLLEITTTVGKFTRHKDIAIM